MRDRLINRIYIDLYDNRIISWQDGMKFNVKIQNMNSINYKTVY